MAEKPATGADESLALGRSRALLEAKSALQSLWGDRIVSLAVIATVGLALAAGTALFAVFDGLASKRSRR